MKLKLVISDFHIGKGRYLPDGRKNYLEDFYQDEKFAEFLESCGEPSLAAKQYYLAGKKLSHRKREAIRYFRKALKLDPRLPTARIALREYQTSPERRRAAGSSASAGVAAAGAFGR